MNVLNETGVGLGGMSEWGWSPKWQEYWDGVVSRDGGPEECVPARVVTEHKGMYRVMSAIGELLVEVSGKLRHEASSRDDYPAVGDWVAVQPFAGEPRGVVRAVLPRFSKFSRKMAGPTPEEQIVAANVDTVLLVCAMNGDFNIRRLERYMVLAWESGARPVVVLTKADLCADVRALELEAEGVAMGVPVFVTSTVSGAGIDEVRALARPGETLAMLGSSGAGKSSLVNALLGQEVQAVQDVREGDDRGRHTTTHREMFLLPGCGVVVDTPGMRELQLWHADDGFGEAFEDVEALTRQCRFSDCTHRGERDCAVGAALASGELDGGRYASYVKLQKELAFLARKDARSRRQQEKASGKKIAKHSKDVYRGE